VGRLDHSFPTRPGHGITDRATGRSKGFGFVEVDSDQEAKAAIDGLGGKMVDGRSLSANDAGPGESRSGGGWIRRQWVVVRALIFHHRGTMNMEKTIEFKDRPRRPASHGMAQSARIRCWWR
jgi:RNA recognition motif-containing protein